MYDIVIINNRLKGVYRYMFKLWHSEFIKARKSTIERSNNSFAGLHLIIILQYGTFSSLTVISTMNLYKIKQYKNDTLRDYPNLINDGIYRLHLLIWHLNRLHRVCQQSSLQNGWTWCDWNNARTSSNPPVHGSIAYVEEETTALAETRRNWYLRAQIFSPSTVDTTQKYMPLQTFLVIPRSSK